MSNCQCKKIFAKSGWIHFSLIVLRVGLKTFAIVKLNMQEKGWGWGVGELGVRIWERFLGEGWGVSNISPFQIESCHMSIPKVLTFQAKLRTSFPCRSNF